MYLTYPKLPSRTHTHTHTHTRTRTHTHAHAHAHTHTHNIFRVPYPVFLLPYAPPVSVSRKFPHNYSCIVTATRYAALFHVWHLLMFYSMLHFLHPYISVHPCCTSAPVHPIPIHTHRYNHERYNGPQHNTALLGSAVPLCTVTLRFNCQLFTDVTVLRVEL